MKPKGKRTRRRALRPQWTESPEPCARQEEVEHNRTKRHDSTASTEACDEPRELVPGLLPAKSRASADINDAGEQALLAEEKALQAKYYADLAQPRLRQKERINRGEFGPNTLC